MQATGSPSAPEVGTGGGPSVADALAWKGSPLTAGQRDQLLEKVLSTALPTTATATDSTTAAATTPTTAPPSAAPAAGSPFGDGDGSVYTSFRPAQALLTTERVPLLVAQYVTPMLTDLHHLLSPTPAAIYCRRSNAAPAGGLLQRLAYAAIGCHRRLSRCLPLMARDSRTVHACNATRQPHSACL